ncbi:transglutaminase-like cysteine peptidase, partial [Rhizobium ruizarguesonis]
MAPAAIPAPSSHASMVTGNATSQPIGHSDFCQIHRSECGANRNAGPVAMTAASWSGVRSVNATVNRTITPMTDKEIYG